MIQNIICYLFLVSNFHFSSISRSSKGSSCLCFKDLCLRIPVCVPQHHPHRPCKTFLGLTPPPSFLENKAKKMQSYPQTSLNFTKLKKLSFNSFQSSDFETVEHIGLKMQPWNLVILIEWNGGIQNLRFSF